jgi:hypothetical protein
MCRSSQIRGNDRRGSDDPQRGVGQDQTPLRVATTSRLGTFAMLDADPRGVQAISVFNQRRSEQRQEWSMVSPAVAAERHAVPRCRVPLLAGHPSEIEPATAQRGDGVQ